MKKNVFTGVRVLFGFAFFIFGINGFFHFMDVPPVTEAAGALLGALGASGYFFPMIKVIESLVGLLLLLNYYSPLAIVLIAPILVGITSIHLFLNPAGLPMMIFLHLLHGYLVYGYWEYYKPILTFKASPKL